MKKWLLLTSTLFTGLFISTIAHAEKDSIIHLYDFKKTTKIDDWNVVNDGVMGGLSQGNFKLSEKGYGVFSGKVSLENNGGFTSIRYHFDTINLSATTSQLVIRVKGDGNRYQLRLKEESNDFSSYITYFETSGEWQTIKIPLNTLYPSYRGRKLPIPNFNKAEVSEIGFLIANKKAEDFKLLIESISFQ